MALVSSQAIPFGGFLVVLFYNSTMIVKLPKVVLGAGIPLFCWLTNPFECFVKVLFYTLTISIHFAKGILGCREALICRFSNPVERFDNIFFNTVTLVIHGSEIVLCKGIPQFCFDKYRCKKWVLIMKYVKVPLSLFMTHKWKCPLRNCCNWIFSVFLPGGHFKLDLLRKQSLTTPFGNFI